MNKKIAILTSGGDAPGMNNVVAQIIKSAFTNNITPYIVKDGYYGLVQGYIEETSLAFANQIINKGGTAIGTSRFEEFEKEATRQIGIDNLKKLGIKNLIVIGGDGSYLGASKLQAMGLDCIGIPGTIDNDIASSQFTVGFDSALNTVNEAIDRIRDTNQSHNRCGIIEVMGRYCGDIAFMSGIGSGVEIVSTSQNRLSEVEIVKQAKACFDRDLRSVLIVVSEKLYDVEQLAKQVEDGSGYVTRATVLGQIQRGGSPTAMDRYLASWMGYFAVEQVIKNKTGVCVGLNDNVMLAIPFKEALKMPRRTLKL